MKKLICAAVMLLPSVALGHTSNHYYGRIDAGIMLPTKTTIANVSNKVSMKNSGMIGAGLGYKFNPNFSTDLNLQYRPLKSKSITGSTEKAKFDALAIMLNGNFELPTATMFIPYGVFGVGYSHLKGHGYTGLKSSNTFAWNVGFGTLIKLPRNTELDFGYKYVDLGKAKFTPATGSENKPKIRGHEFKVGFLFGF